MVPCITVLLIIVATILFVCLIKRFLKKPKGYPFETTICLDHTNTIADDAPDEIKLTLNDSEEDKSDVIKLPETHSQFTFHNLTPSAEYSVEVAVKNADGSKEGEAISFITKPTGTHVCIQFIHVYIIILNLYLFVSISLVL